MRSNKEDKGLLHEYSHFFKVVIFFSKNLINEVETNYIGQLDFFSFFLRSIRLFAHLSELSHSSIL